MKLNLKDSAKTVITSIDTKIDRKGDWSEGKGYFYYIAINGLRLEYIGKNAQKESQNDFNKLLSKGAVKNWTPYVSEEDKAWADGVSADCSDPKKHGHVVYSILSADPNQSGCFVWDYNKQSIVRKEDLSPAPNIDK